MSEMVNHPSHYNQEGRKECIVEMEELFGKFETAKWALITAYKYLYRAGAKEGNSFEQDMDKVEWYIRYVVKEFNPGSVYEANIITEMFNKVRCEFESMRKRCGL